MSKWTVRESDAGTLEYYCFDTQLSPNQVWVVVDHYDQEVRLFESDEPGPSRTFIPRDGAESAEINPRYPVKAVNAAMHDLAKMLASGQWVMHDSIYACGPIIEHLAVEMGLISAENPCW